LKNECIELYKKAKKDWTWKPNDKPFEFPIVDQIKEKFGALRFYASTPTGTRYELRGMIQMAEAMSACTCEDCGNKGKPRKDSWVRTLCDICYKKQNKGKRFEGLKNI